ncbi:hypothetical protein KIPB_000617 [Kipferlia bialata]|uniref:Uncharacterized protein n=1 Tax=Kipferlia bialata TaxID=797122 RepID=A0A9K3CPC4_9EUKA|nr:hypothetical protein KIPB_000617 [Kipferlia bialata]|eukprot:g617.t1
MESHTDEHIDPIPISSTSTQTHMVSCSTVSSGVVGGGSSFHSLTPPPVCQLTEDTWFACGLLVANPGTPEASVQALSLTPEGDKSPFAREVGCFNSVDAVQTLPPSSIGPRLMVMGSLVYQVDGYSSTCSKATCILQFKALPDSPSLSPCVSLSILRAWRQGEWGNGMEYKGVLGDGRLLLKVSHGPGLMIAPTSLLDKAVMSQEELQSALADPGHIHQSLVMTEEYSETVPEECRPVSVDYDPEYRMDDIRLTALPGWDLVATPNVCLALRHGSTKPVTLTLVDKADGADINTPPLFSLLTDPSSPTPTHLLPLYKTGTLVTPIPIPTVLSALEGDMDVDPVCIEVETTPTSFGETRVVAGDMVIAASDKASPPTPFFSSALDEAKATFTRCMAEQGVEADNLKEYPRALGYSFLSDSVLPLPTPCYQTVAAIHVSGKGLTLLCSVGSDTQVALTLTRDEVTAGTVPLGEACDMAALARLTQFSQYTAPPFGSSSDNGVTPVVKLGKFIQEAMPAKMDVYKITHAPKYYRIRYVLVGDKTGEGEDPLSAVPMGLRHPDIEVIEEARLGDMIGAPIWKGGKSNPMNVESGFVVGFSDGRRDGGARVGTQRRGSSGLGGALGWGTDWAGVPVLVSLPNNKQVGEQAPKAEYDWNAGTIKAAGLTHPLPYRGFEVVKEKGWGGAPTVDLIMTDPAYDDSDSCPLITDAATGRWNTYARPGDGCCYAETIALHESVPVPESEDDLFKRLTPIEGVNAREYTQSGTVGEAGELEGVGKWMQFAFGVGVDTNRAGYFTKHLFKKKDFVSVAGLGESGPEAFIFDEEYHGGVGWESVTGFEPEAPVPGGWFSDSGWGDGCYFSFVLRDGRGKAVGARILYVQEPEPEAEAEGEGTADK